MSRARWNTSGMVFIKRHHAHRLENEFSNRTNNSSRVRNREMCEFQHTLPQSLGKYPHSVGKWRRKYPALQVTLQKK